MLIKMLFAHFKVTVPIPIPENFIKVTVTELKDDRIEKYGSLFVFISKKHCRATLKNLLADGRGG